MLLSRIWQQKEFDESFRLWVFGQEVSFEQFIHEILVEIGSVLVGKTTRFLAESYPYEAHVLVAHELIAFVRILLRGFSRTAEAIGAVLHGILASNSDLNLDKSDLRELTGLFAILGNEVTNVHELGFAIRIAKSGSVVVKVVAHDPVTGFLLADGSAPASSEVEQDGFVSSARVSADPSDFVLTAEEVTLLVRTQEWGLHHMSEFGIAESLFFAHFTGFLATALQTEENAKVFLEHADLSSFCDFAQLMLPDFGVASIPHLMKGIGHALSSIVRIGPASRTQYLPHTLSWNSVTPTQFVAMGSGSATDSCISSDRGVGLFVGNCAVADNVALYFEVTTAHLLEKDIKVGFVSSESRTTESELRFFGLAVAERIAISSTITSLGRVNLVSSGERDTLGCGLVESALCFVLNGKPLETVIDCPNLSDRIPAVFTNSECTLEYNFGQKPFVADVLGIPMFGLAACFTVPLTVSAPPASVTLSDDFDALVAQGRPIYSVLRRAEGSVAAYPERATLTSGDCPVKFVRPADDPVPSRPFWIGQPCIVARTRTLSGKLLSDAARQRFHHVCTIVSLDKHAKVTVRFAELWAVKQGMTVSLHPEFLDALESTLEQVVESHWLGPVHLEKFRDRCKKYSMSYSIRMVRHFFFALLCHYQGVDEFGSFLASPRFVSLFPLLMSEVFNTATNIKMKVSWCISRQSDLILIRNGGLLDDFSHVPFKVPADRHAWRRFVRALVIRHPAEMNLVLRAWLSYSFDSLPNAQEEGFEDVWRLVPRQYRFASLRSPCEIDFVHEFQLPPETVGFLPIIGHPQEACPNVEVNKCSANMAKCSVWFDASRVVKVKARTAGKARLHVGILPVWHSLPESHFFSPLGGVHRIFVVLSFIISTKKLPELETFLKRHVFSRLIDSMNVVTQAFLTELLSPILRRCAWTPSDMTPELSSLFEAIRESAASRITEWAPLSQRDERSLLLAFSTWSHQQELTPPGDQLFEVCAGMSATLRHSVFGGFMRLISLMSLLAFGAPVWAHFPMWLFAESWLQYDDARDISAFLADVDLVANHWKESYDRDLTDLLGAHPDISKQRPIELRAAPFDGYVGLIQLSPRAVWTRLQLITSLSVMMEEVLKVVDMARRNASRSVIVQLLSSCRACLPAAFKRQLADMYLIDHGRAARHDVPFNRSQARDFFRQPTNPLGRPMFYQLIDYIEKTEVGVRMLNRTGATPWKAGLGHEHAIDAGGPGRDTFTEVLLEIGNPALGLFIPTPNMTRQEGEQQDLLMPNPEPFQPGSFRENCFLYVGALFAVCFPAKLFVSLPIVSFVWNALAGRAVTVQDIFDMDTNFEVFITGLRDVNPETDTPARFLSLVMSNYQVTDSTGKLVPLIEGGASIPLRMDQRFDFIEQALQFRLKEFVRPLEALKRGFYTFCPEAVARCMMPTDIQLFLCGVRGCPVERLMELCHYDRSAKENEMLWKILSEFTDQQRLLFVKFATGRTGLPPPGVTWQNPLTIAWESDSKPDRDKGVPKAETCSSRIILKVCQSEEWLRKKLLAALNYGLGLTSDHILSDHDIVAIIEGR
jgi:hypothetical protein